MPSAEAGGSLPFILFGKNAEEGIVAVDTPSGGETPEAIVYVRSPAGSITTRHERVYPFAFVTRPEDLSHVPRASYRMQKLDGSLEYQYLAVFDSWRDYHDAYSSRRVDPERGYDPVFRLAHPTQQYLLQSGHTCFKGMQFDDLHRLQLDIEVRSDRGFPRARRQSDSIIIVAMSDNRGWHRVLDARPDGEAGLLARMIDTIIERDPDVVEGHNIFRFDLPYIEARCKLHGIRFSVGRGGGTPRKHETSMRFAERSFEFTSYEIPGRHVVDTFLLTMAFDVSRRRLPGFGLKEVARYFGVAEPDRTYIDGDRITETWDSDPDRLVAYALDDVKETGAIARLLSGSNFYVTQMTPMSYQEVSRSGPGAKIESLMIRAYLTSRHSLPAPRPIGTVSGAYTDVLYTGVASPVVYADVESLYPSIMLQQDIRPSTDPLDAFPELLRHLTTLRLEAKQAMKESVDPDARAELDARQSSYKVLINSFYGYLGFGRALFNDSAEADRVTRSGQAILRTAMSIIEESGGRIVEVDTDGIFFVPPSEVKGAGREEAFVRDVSAQLPPGIVLAHDGRYAKMLSYKVKNYALLDYDGRLSIKGSSLVSRATERFGRRYVRRCIKLLLNEDIRGLHDAYLDARGRIARHDWTDVEDFSRSETLKERLGDYVAAVESGDRQRSAAYEVALTLQERGRRIRKGDRISFYIARLGGERLFESARPASDWNPDDPDEDTAYYLRRLDEFSRKFQVFFHPPDYRAIFSEEDLFGFSPDRIAFLFG